MIVFIVTFFKKQGLSAIASLGDRMWISGRNNPHYGFKNNIVKYRVPRSSAMIEWTGVRNAEPKRDDRYSRTGSYQKQPQRIVLMEMGL